MFFVNSLQDAEAYTTIISIEIIYLNLTEHQTTNYMNWKQNTMENAYLFFVRRNSSTLHPHPITNLQFCKELGLDEQFLDLFGVEMQLDFD